MSAGRLRATPVSSGRCGRRRPGFSFSGWSPARSAQVQSKSRSALCRWLRSPPAMQTPACREKVSRTLSERGHHPSLEASATPSRWRNSAVNTAGSMRFGPAGTAARNARPPGSASERSIALRVGQLASSCNFQACMSAWATKVRCRDAKAISMLTAPPAVWL